MELWPLHATDGYNGELQKKTYERCGKAFADSIDYTRSFDVAIYIMELYFVIYAVRLTHVRLPCFLLIKLDSVPRDITDYTITLFDITDTWIWNKYRTIRYVSNIYPSILNFVII